MLTSHGNCLQVLFKQGFSLSIPESAKPGIYTKVRRIVTAEHLAGAVAGAIVMAILVNIIELLCTAGLPALYTNILVQQGLSPVSRYGYLTLYILAYMFDDTLVRNIAFGDPEPDFDRVLRAAQLANAHDFISRLPLGYESRVGESGLALSGGQKQRIAIARAIYSDPPILIFDEATSALDTESERAIQTNMRRFMAGRTSLVIAHRLSTIRDADTIVVLEKGQVAEKGTHDELMAVRGLYFYLASQQLGL